jgi:hypothetical protein
MSLTKLAQTYILQGIRDDVECQLVRSFVWKLVMMKRSGQICLCPEHNHNINIASMILKLATDLKYVRRTQIKTAYIKRLKAD